MVRLMAGLAKGALQGQKMAEIGPEDDEAGSAELMYVKCAYCGKWMDVKPGHMHWVSHGLCEDCLKKELEKARAAIPPERATS